MLSGRSGQDGCIPGGRLGMSPAPPTYESLGDVVELLSALNTRESALEPGRADDCDPTVESSLCLVFRFEPDAVIVGAAVDDDPSCSATLCLASSRHKCSMPRLTQREQGR